MTIESTIKARTSVEKFSSHSLPVKKGNHHLTLEWQDTHLLAALLDKGVNEYITLLIYPLNEEKDKTSSLKKLLDEPVFHSSISGVSVAFTQGKSSLVPALFFRKEKAKEYLHILGIDKAGEDVCCDYIKSNDSYNLYTIEKGMKEAILDRFPSALFRHHSTVFIESLLIENKNSKATFTALCLLPGIMDALVIKEGNLLLHNRFNIMNDHDIAYYTLWIYEQLQLDAETVPCLFYGEAGNESESFRLCSNYIKTVNMGAGNENFTYSFPLLALPVHKYRFLFSQYQCV